METKVRMAALLAFLGCNVDLPRDQILNRTASATVRILVNEKTACTGVIVKHTFGKTWVVTAAHCVKVDEYVYLKTFGGVIYEGKTIFLDPKVDLAIVEVDATIHQAVLRIGKSIKMWDPVYTIGHSLYALYFPNEGLYSGVYNYDELLRATFSMHSMPGSSGSPIVNSKGELISILTNADGNVTLGCTLVQLRDFLE